MHNRHFNISIVCIVFAMLIPLFPIPGPSVVTGHPWKVELALSIAVAIILVRICTQSAPSAVEALFASRHRIYAIGAVLAFTFWSGISGIWAEALYSVAHHTGSWFVYTAILFLALFYFVQNRSVFSVTAIFGALSAVLLAVCIFDYLSIAGYGFREGVIRIRYAKYGELLAMTGPFLFSAAFYARGNFARAVPLAAGCAAWLVVMLSLSKGAFIAGIAGFALVFIGCICFAGRKIRKPALVAAVIWLALTAGVQVLFISYSSVPATAQYISGHAETRETSNFRIFTWKIGASMA
ncbi:MAG: hypothetical protein OEM82_15055, partial [Acidobacteriota bacterium]|nr:hypothetical protein [Acidobacteriota bacterium]